MSDDREVSELVVFKTTMAALLADDPDISVTEAFLRADEIMEAVKTTLEGTVGTGGMPPASIGHLHPRWIAWAASQSDIRDIALEITVPSGGKIRAIKEMRSRTSFGLKEAKELVEAAYLT